MIPNKIEETKTLYYRMQRDGYPLDYLNIEYNLNVKLNMAMVSYLRIILSNKKITLNVIRSFIYC